MLDGVSIKLAVQHECIVRKGRTAARRKESRKPLRAGTASVRVGVRLTVQDGAAVHDKRIICEVHHLLLHSGAWSDDTADDEGMSNGTVYCVFRGKQRRNRVLLFAFEGGAAIFFRLKHQ